MSPRRASSWYHPDTESLQIHARMHFARLVEENVPQLRKDLEESVVPPARDFAAELGTHDDARALKEFIGSNITAFLYRLDHGSGAARGLAGAFREWCQKYRLYDHWLWRAALESVLLYVGGMALVVWEEAEIEEDGDKYTASILEPTVLPNEFSLDHPLDDGLAAPDWEMVLKPGTSVLMHGLNVRLAWGLYAKKARRLARRKLGGDKLPKAIRNRVDSQLEEYRHTVEEWVSAEGFEPMPDIRHRAGDPYLWTVQHQFPTGDPPSRRSFDRISFLQRQGNPGGREPSAKAVAKAVGRISNLLPLQLRDAPRRPAKIPAILLGPLTEGSF